LTRYYWELAVRSLKRNPWLSASIVITLAIGIGTCMTALSLLHVLAADPVPGKSATLFQPRRAYFDATHAPYTKIDYAEAQELVAARTTPSSGVILAESFGVSNTLDTLKSKAPTLVLHTTRDFFGMFDVPFRAGGAWSEQADEDGDHVAVIGNDLALKLFGATSVVGQEVRYGGVLFRIVGVLKRWRQTPRVYSFETGGAFIQTDDLYTPIKAVRDLDANTLIPYDCDVGSGAATTERGQSIAGHNDRLFTSSCGWASVWVELPTATQERIYRDFLTRLERPAYRYTLDNIPALLLKAQVVPTDVRVYSLLGVGFLLLCVLSASGALLGKFFRAGFETGLRRALGASRRQIRVQFITESLLLGLCGGILGSAFSVFGLKTVRELRTAFSEVIALDSKMLLLTLVISLVGGLLAGLLPAWRASRIDPGLQIRTSA
jgi:putative ABC transport system permease protein